MVSQLMEALVYTGPYAMVLDEVHVPPLQPDEVRVAVRYSGICGSELSGYEGKNALRKPPLIMGHEFSGYIDAIGEQAAARFPELAIGMPVTANPFTWCGRCDYCMSGRQQLCPERKLLSASLPGSNAQYVSVRADTVLPLPPDMPLTTGALTEPAACAVRAAQCAAPTPGETGLVVGAGPIGLLCIQALARHGLKTIYAADLNPERLNMAEALGAIPVELDAAFKERVDVALDAVGAAATRRACVAAARASGRVIWVGLHEPESPLPVNDMIRREIVARGSFAYSMVDFRNALKALHARQLRLDDSWTRIEPLHAGAACFEALLHGAAVAKIWLAPRQPD